MFPADGLPSVVLADLIGLAQSSSGPYACVSNRRLMAFILAPLRSWKEGQWGNAQLDRCCHHEYFLQAFARLLRSLFELLLLAKVALELSEDAVSAIEKHLNQVQLRLQHAERFAYMRVNTWQGVHLASFTMLGLFRQILGLFRHMLGTPACVPE